MAICACVAFIGIAVPVVTTSVAAARNPPTVPTTTTPVARTTPRAVDPAAAIQSAYLDRLRQRRLAEHTGLTGTGGRP
jgi:hypothetical protein